MQSPNTAVFGSGSQGSECYAGKTWFYAFPVIGRRFGGKTWGYTHLLCLSFPTVCQKDSDFEMSSVPEMTRAVPEVSPPRFV
jgi:hypothetical protein